MPVSSAMLVSGEPNAFPRQQAGTTSSVRLRKRRDDLAAPGRRKERHSGDFSYTTRLRPDLASEPSDSEGDWNYITFPQKGEATVQEVRVTTPSSRGGDAHQTSRGGADPNNPVRLRTSLQSSRAISSSAVNLQKEPQGRNPRYSEVPQMRTQDIRPHLRKGQEEPRMIRANPRPEDVKLHVRPRQQQDQLKSPHGQEPGVKLRVKPRGEDSSCPHRRQSHMADLSPVPREEKKGNSKRCSGEFEFRKGGRMVGTEWSHVAQIEDLGNKAEEQSFTHEMVMRELSGGACDTGSEGSEESGVFSTGSSQESPSKPRPGLGRRAVTQMDMKERKNSYNSALARSQENLVTASPDVLGVEADLTLKKGLLWQQRDKLFSRWKERYFILTRDLLQCFKKGTSRITEMGEFIFSIKLPEVEAIELLDKRGYLTICISLQREGKVYLRRTEGIRDWYNAIRESMEESKVRRNNRASAIFADRRQNTDCSGMEGFVAGRKLGRLGAFSDSTPEVNKGDKERITLDELSRLYRKEEEEEERKQEADTKMNRLSMMSCEEHGGELDLEKGVFLRRREADSGNNSLQSSTGTASSKLSQPRECNSFLEEEEADYEEERPSPEVRIKRPAANTNIIEVRYRERNPPRGTGRQHGGVVEQQRRKSRHVNRLQITNV